jgi:hypothetical protein
METPTKLSWYSSALLKLQLIPFCFSVVAVQVQGAEREVLLVVLLNRTCTTQDSVDPIQFNSQQISSSR